MIDLDAIAKQERLLLAMERANELVTNEQAASNQFSKLDYFAAAALTGGFADPNSVGTCESFAVAAYKFARAMIEEGKKHEVKP
jgi:hypothetical protein